MLYLYINNSVNQVVRILKIANIPVLTGSAAALFEKKMRPNLGTWVVRDRREKNSRRGTRRKTEHMLYTLFPLSVYS